MAKQQETSEKWNLTIEDVFDMPIAYHRVFAFWVGVCGSVFLSQAIYWSKRTSDPEGWFYKTQKEWTLETGLTRREQETARRDAIKAGFLEEKLAGNPARMYYRVTLEPILKKLSLAETYKQDSTKRANKNVQNEQTIYTENTTKISSEEKISEINNENLEEEFDSWKQNRKARKQGKGRVFPPRSGFDSAPSYQKKEYQVREKKGAHGEHII